MPRSSSLCLAATAVLALAAALAAGDTAVPLPLPALSIDPAGISISGLSSGADFVVQFQVAFAATVKVCHCVRPTYCAQAAD